VNRSFGGPLSIPACALGAIRVFSSFGELAQRLTRHHRFSLDDFRPIESGAATAMMRHALARRVENAFARFRVFREGREGDAFDESEVRAGIAIIGPAFLIPLCLF
jgi:hypothetical protein